MFPKQNKCAKQGGLTSENGRSVPGIIGIATIFQSGSPEVRSWKFKESYNMQNYKKPKWRWSGVLPSKPGNHQASLVILSVKCDIDPRPSCNPSISETGDVRKSDDAWA